MHMKFILSLVSLFVSLGTLFSQTVVWQRSALLMEENYKIEGTAFLEELDDGTLQLRLSDDFSTPNGPDVRIFLNDSISGTGGIQISNLSADRHFSGALTLDVPTDVGINDYSHIVFYCQAFSQLWASGVWGEAEAPDSNMLCEGSSVTLADGATMIDLCVADDLNDSLEFINSLALPAIGNYAYLLTDQNEILQEVIMGSKYLFDSSNLDAQRVYGIHYDGDLEIKIGEHRTETTASGCHIHSDENLFLTITKSACIDTVECLESLTATEGWVTEVDICATDDIPDEILLKNNIGLHPGENYAYLLTDSSEVLIEIIFDSIYNFEGLEGERYRVYGLHYSGDLVPAIGEDRKNTSASGCFNHSGDNLFLTVNTGTNCTVSSNNSDSENNVKIFPNPSHGIVNIEIENSRHFEKIEVFGARGEKVAELIGNTRIRLDKTGIYVFRILYRSEFYSKRILIMN